LHARLVGEPVGGKPASYGEVKMLTLPNSALVVRYTSKYFGASNGWQAETLSPDIPASQTLTDWLAGQDRVLSAALAD